MVSGVVTLREPFWTSGYLTLTHPPTETPPSPIAIRSIKNMPIANAYRGTLLFYLTSVFCHWRDGYVVFYFLQKACLPSCRQVGTPILHNSLLATLSHFHCSPLIWNTIHQGCPLVHWPDCWNHLPYWPCQQGDISTLMLRVHSFMYWPLYIFFVVYACLRIHWHICHYVQAHFLFGIFGSVLLCFAITYLALYTGSLGRKIELGLYCMCMCVIALTFHSLCTLSIYIHDIIMSLQVSFKTPPPKD